MNDDDLYSDRYIYHIASKNDWLNALKTREFSEPSLSAEGFIHFSTFSQVQQSANKFHKGQTGLVVLEVDCDKLPIKVTYEQAENGVWFPHLYGPLFTDAVSRVIDFPANQDGSFTWPVPGMDR